MSILVAGVVMLVWLACTPIPPHPVATDEESGFSRELLEAHLLALGSLGPRTPGSESNARAREYLSRELELVGARPPREAPRRDGLLVEIPGRTSSDLIVLLAPYAILGEGAAIDDSGLSICLELARQLARNTPEYRVLIAMPEVRAESELRSPGASASSALASRAWAARAGEALVEELRAAGLLARVRGVVSLEPSLAAPTRLARDLRSNPIVRSLFWSTADRLGYAHVFPEDALWTSPVGVHSAFVSAGIGQVLALTDESKARAELIVDLGSIEGGGAAAPRTDSPGQGELDALVAVGEVTLVSLETLMARFARIDAFSQ